MFLVQIVVAELYQLADRLTGPAVRVVVQGGEPRRVDPGGAPHGGRRSENGVLGVGEAHAPRLVGGCGHGGVVVQLVPLRSEVVVECSRVGFGHGADAFEGVAELAGDLPSGAGLGVEVLNDASEPHAVEPPDHRVDRRSLLGDEQHRAPLRGESGDEIRDGLGFAGAGRTLDHQVAASEDLADGDVLGRIGGEDEVFVLDGDAFEVGGGHLDGGVGHVSDGLGVSGEGAGEGVGVDRGGEAGQVLHHRQLLVGEVADGDGEVVVEAGDGSEVLGRAGDQVCGCLEPVDGGEIDVLRREGEGGGEFGAEVLDERGVDEQLRGVGGEGEALAGGPLRIEAERKQQHRGRRDGTGSSGGVGPGHRAEGQEAGVDAALFGQLRGPAVDRAGPSRGVGTGRLVEEGVEINGRASGQKGQLLGLAVAEIERSRPPVAEEQK